MRRVGAHIRKNVVGYVAIFIALGGTSYAALDLPRRSVKAKHIANRAVKSRHIGAGAIKRGQIADGAVTAEKLAKGVALAGARGPQGERGPRGEPGPQGPEGPSALRLDFDQPDSDWTVTPLGTLHELTVKAECRPDSDSPETSISLHVESSVAATINYFGGRTQAARDCFATDQSLQNLTPASTENYSS